MKYSIPLLVFVFLQLTGAEISKDLAHFEYDRSALLNVKELSIQDRGGVTVHDITYASPRGGLVPAYLVVPNGKGKFAGIVWGHWMMPNSHGKPERISGGSHRTRAWRCGFNSYRYSVRAAWIQRGPGSV